MARNNCLIVTPGIESLARKAKGETPQSIATAIGLWQEKNNSSDIPSLHVLKSFITSIRDDIQVQRIKNALDRYIQDPSVQSVSPLNDHYTTVTRKQRVNLISQMFSDRVDKLLKDKKLELQKQLEEAKSIADVGTVGFDWYQKNIDQLTREEVIEAVGINTIFNDIKKAFELASNPEQWADFDNADKMAEEYTKIVKYFDYFMPEVAQVLAVTENMFLRGNNELISDINLSEINELGEDYDSEESNQYTKEEEYKDHWMEQAKFVNPITSLSKETRAFLRRIPQLNADGTEVEDDLGNVMYVDSHLAHAVLIKELSGMTKPENMIPRLEKIYAKHPWVSMVIEELENPEKETLAIKMYRDFRKDFQEMWVQTRELLPNGKYKYKTVSVNRKDDPLLTIKDWQSDIESNIKFDDNAIFDSRGNISKDLTQEALDLVYKLQAKLHNLSPEEKVALLDDNAFFDDLVSSINRAGIGVNPALIKSALSNLPDKTDGISFSDTNIDKVLNALLKIYQGVLKTPIKSTDLTTSYNSQYKIIATNLNQVGDSDIISAIREAGKAYYGYIAPSYFGKLINELRGLNGDAQFKEFIQSEFGNYDWFYDRVTNEWINPWIEAVVKEKDVKEKLNYHIVLNANITKGKKEYADWTQLDNMIIMLNEYFSDGWDTKAKNPFAYYRLPILSDTQTAESVHFKRYTNYTGGRDAFGNNESYQEQILNQMEKLVRQEFNRIVLVQQREQQIVNGIIKPINNFDISRNPDGTIKSLGGSEFKFLPKLNSLKDTYFHNDNKLFIDKLNQMINDRSPELNNFIKESIREVIESGFEQAIDHWDRIKLFEQTENGELKYLGVNGNRETALPYLNEFYWNDIFARANIIQLTTTDLAFYKPGIDDFQKRYKQTEAKTIKLDTTIRPGGYAKKQQRTVYLKDEDNFISSALEDIRKVLTKRVSDGLLENREKDAILNKFGGLVKKGKKGINVTDAQAYMSLDGYRSLQYMAGQWDETTQGRAYQNFIDNTWTFEDFNVLFQPVKPFMYTQTAVRSGLENSSDIKVPVQHKNAIYLLLAAHEVISGPLNQSTKLKALNKWMMQNNIDIVQFESAVKVGGQGVINLNNTEGLSETEIIDYLNDQITLGGQENTDVVHTLNYDDYGIQVELPQHTIDTQILDGTQLRALIVSDLPADAVFSIQDAGKDFSKEELITLYNQLLIENIAISAQNVQNIFDNPYRLNEELLNEMRGNPRYDTDSMDAIKLKSDGRPILPYWDATSVQKVEALLSSIPKSQIIRQKMKGGAYVQVSNFGLTKELNIVFNEDGSVKHWEVHMPYWSRNLFKNAFIEGTHELDISKIPDDLREAIGFRIPTENKYSMPPLYIKGFLPRSSGDAIMMPADVTAVLGSDFDVDKLYVYLPEFKVNKGKLEKVKYDYSKSPEEQSLAARNNAIFDIRRSILTNPAISSQSMIPGNYDKQKQAASIITLAQNLTPNKLKKIIGLDNNANEKDIIDKLMTYSIDEIDTLAKSVRDELDPLSPITQLLLHERNMTGAKMIGVFANNKKHHALMQYTDLEIFNDASFVLNNKSLTKLNQIYTTDGDARTYISEFLSGFLAASVDNGKDPVLGFMNINGYTANVAALLARLGYSPLTISLFLSHPTIKIISDNYNNGNKRALDDYIKALSTKKKDNDESNPLTDDYLLSDILNNNESIIVAERFEKIQKIAEDLARLTRIRVDNRDGGIGPDIANTIINKKRLERLIYDIQNNGSFTLSGADFITQELGDISVTDAKREALNTPVPYINMFYAGGLGRNKQIMQPYTFKYTETLEQMYDALVELSAVEELDPALLNKAYNEWIAFKASKYEFFGNDDFLSVKDKRENMIKSFPKYFNDVISRNSMLADLPFLKKLAIIKKDNVPFKTLEFVNANHLTTAQKADFKRDWAYLTNHKDPEARRLGIGLMLYSMYKNGLGFGPSSFANMAPVAVKLATPQYVEMLEALVNNDKESVRNFAEQFFRNHLNEDKLVESLDKTTPINNIDGVVEIENKHLVMKFPNLIKDRIDHGDKIQLVTKNYFSHNGKYYVKTDQDDVSSIYIEVKPLGVKNGFIEYEYGKNGFEVESIIKKNNINIPESLRDLQNAENEDLINTEAEDKLTREYKELSLYLDDIESLILQSIYGTTEVPGEQNIPNKKKSIMAYTENEEFKDADNLPLC